VPLGKPSSSSAAGTGASGGGHTAISIQRSLDGPAASGSGAASPRSGVGTVKQGTVAQRTSASGKLVTSRGGQPAGPGPSRAAINLQMTPLLSNGGPGGGGGGEGRLSRQNSRSKLLGGDDAV
jgi:hypothetical protein